MVTEIEEDLGLPVEAMEDFSTSPSTWQGILAAVSEVSSTEPKGGLLTTVGASLEDPWQRSTASLVLQCLVLCLMWLLGFLGNVLVCIVIHRSRRLQSTTNSFVVSLACTDLLLCLTVMPLVLVETVVGRWSLGSGLCKLVRFIQWLVPSASMLVLTCICIDRFYSIIYPLSFKITRGRAKRMILAGWAGSILLACPAFYFYGLEWRGSGDRQSKHGPHCTALITEDGSAGSVIYICLVSSIMYFGPILVDIGGYLRIFKFIWRAGVGGRTFQRTMNPVPRAKVKMVKMMMVVTFINVALFAPLFIVQLWHCSIRTPGVDPDIYTVALWFYFATAMSKPGAYMCFNSNFRRGCKEVFCMSTMKCYRSHAYTITTASKLGKKNHVGVILEPSFNRDSDYHRIDSPARHFERALAMEKNSWPAANSMPSTYL